jgi:glycosidase
MHRIGRRGLLKGLLLAGVTWQLPPVAAARGNASETELKFSVSGLELSFDKDTGAWTELADQKTGAVFMKFSPESSDFVLTVGGKESVFPPLLRPPGEEELSGAATVTGFKYTSHLVTDEGETVILTVNYRQGQWSVSQEYRIVRGQQRVERRFRVGYDGTDEPLLHSVEVPVPDVLLHTGDLIEIPAAAFPPSLAPASVAGRALGLGDTSMAALRNASGRRTFLMGTYSETENVRQHIQVEGDSLKFRYTVRLAARMKAGRDEAWGEDYFWLTDDDWRAAQAEFQQRWSQLGVHTPDDRPRWAERAVLYETQVGAALFDRGKHAFNPYPTTQSLIGKLDYIRGLGFNALQLMPRSPCPSYAVCDYFDPEQQFCGQPGLKNLVQEAHKRGMRVILDWIVHGVIDKEIARSLMKQISSVRDQAYLHSGLPDYVLNFGPAWLESAPEINPLRARHPDWFMKFQDGSLGHIYTWAFDLANPQLQKYMIDALVMYVRDYDVDGFRVDAPMWNSFPNWDPKIPYRASLSQNGGIRLFDLARPAVHAIKPAVMFYTEAMGPAFRRSFDVNYAYDEIWALEAMLAWHKIKPPDVKEDLRVATPRAPAGLKMTARMFREWLDGRRRTMPKGSMTIHQVDSHDSFWWLPWGYKFRRQQFGPEGYRAWLFAVAMIEGGLMQYPTAEEGNEQFTRRVLTLRANLPQLNEGYCDYLGVEVSDDAVFAVSWESPQGWAVPLTNLGPNSLDVRVSLPPARFAWEGDSEYVVREVFNLLPVHGQGRMTVRGRDLENLRLRMGSLQSALLVIDKVPRP